MKAVSLFSGVGGFELGFERAGIETVLQVEKDPWCLSVLERHWREVERLDDVCKVDAATWAGRRRDVVGERDGADGERLGGTPRGAAGVDFVYGGFPCQDLSVAGRRRGFRGERSSLWFEFERVLSELRPRWAVVENVPGLLSSDYGRDFHRVLLGLGQLGYGVAWRVLDARFFGVAQRRRRVFVVGCLGDAQRAAQVLAVCESCGGYPAARREATEDIAPTLDDGARRAGVDLPMIAFGGNNTSGEIDVASARSSRANRFDFDTDTFLVAAPVRASDGHHGHSSGRGDGADNFVVQQGVRRLTPLECERLMGFPDDHTRYAADGREIPDSHRYRMCGNGVVAPVAGWLGHRLVEVDRWR